MVNNLKYINDSSLSSSSISLTDTNDSMNSTTSMSEQNERTVYLGDLDLDINESTIEDFFISIDIKTLKIIKQPHSSFAHVTFENTYIAKCLLEKAIISMNGKVIRVMPFNQPNNFDPNANLIIKNLESNLNELHIVQKFKVYGDILSCKLVRGPKGESKCYAYLQFKHKSSANDAIDNLNNTYWFPDCDPDINYKRYKEKMLSLKQNNYGFDENKLFNEFNTNKIQHGKKIYVGLFKKKDEYFKIKQDKEGKASNLYVKNFGNNFGDRDLFNLFKSFGSIKSAKVRRQKCGLIEKPLGCGFVDFENPEEAELARVALNGKTLPSGRVISVTYADCKSRRMRKKLEENCNLNNINNIINNNNNSNISSSSSNDEDDDNNSMILNQTISNNNNNNIENESPLILTDNLSQENEKFTFINTTNIYDYNNNNNENRFRSDSNSSETSFDLILTDWSERWNRQLHSEYRLFY